MRRIAWNLASGGNLILTTPAIGGRLVPWQKGAITFDQYKKLTKHDAEPAEWAETEDEWYARIIASDLPADATDVRIVDSDDIPVDRTFRDAWVLNDDVVEVDMPQAREIHKDVLRELRAPQLEALDVSFMKALETNDKATLADIVEKKEALRDVTDDPMIEAADTPEELKAAIPEALGEVFKGALIGVDASITLLKP